jgi:hypothetical protein
MGNIGLQLITLVYHLITYGTNARNQLNSENLENLKYLYF